MRKLKLQIQISIDGFVDANDGTNFNWDDELRAYSIENTKEVDCILLGRNTVEGFIPHWASVASNPNDPDHLLGKRLTEIPKIVFSNSMSKAAWSNVEIQKGEITEGINKLKIQSGKEMLVYGGSSFVSSLIREGLIDQYHLLINPFAMGTGLAIFQSLKSQLALTLVKSMPFRSGTVLLIYEPKS